MPIGTLFVAPEWHLSAEGQSTLAAFKNKQNNKRRCFHFLERPAFPAPYPDIFEYKIFLSGKTGVGKSSVVAKLSANVVHRAHHETLGIQTSTVFWPAKVVEVERIVLFKLQFWDVGENTLAKYDHLMPALKDSADAAMFAFSFVDKSSFSELPHRMTRVTADNESLCKFVIGAKLDKQGDIEVTQSEVADFESRWSVKVLHVANVLSTPSAQSDCDDVASTLNYVCDQLWLRDQMLHGDRAAQR